MRRDEPQHAFRGGSVVSLLWRTECGKSQMQTTARHLSLPEGQGGGAILDAWLGFDVLPSPLLESLIGEVAGLPSLWTMPRKGMDKRDCNRRCDGVQGGVVLG
ncbi:hypothetical protein PLESTF_000687800 [Pleodorina starrii]|nr:hypothetical protein PLESTF_000687800 [Pleodorina starrii]